jgi:flagellar hook-length control protein FliK
MQAPTVQNQANVGPSPTSNAKSQSASDVPFNQMLTQQIADRSNVSGADETSSPNSTSKVSETKQADDTTQTGNSGPDSVSKQTGTTDSSDTKVAGKDKTQDSDDSKKAAASTAVPISAELMALVANHLNQANAQPAATEAKTAINTKEILSTEIDTKAATDKTQITELTGKETSAKSTASFAATMSAMEQAADPKQALEAAKAKLQDALPAMAAATPQLQQTALNAAQLATGQPTDKLTPQVGSPAWDQALGQKVVWMVAGSQQSAALTLNPPDLGPLHVVLHVSNGHADASFTASQPEVRQALEAAMPKLREMMSDAGIQLGQATIGTGMPNQQNRSGESSGQNSRGFGQANDSADTTTRITGTTKITGGQGLVDTFA